MASIRTVFAWVLLGTLSCSAHADIYKYIDKDGNLVLTDQAVPGATKVQEKPVMTIPALKGSSTTGPAKKAAGSDDPNRPYNIRVTSPVADSTYQRNSGDSVPIAVSVDPALRAGNNLQVMLDGSPFDGDSVPLDQLDRGTHNVSAQVVDGAGKVVQPGPSVNFFVQQFSPLNQATPQPRSP